MNCLDFVARVTRVLPPRVGASVGWRVGEYAHRGPRIARLKSGGRLVVDVGDYQHRQVFFLGEYEPRITRLLRRLVRPGWTVIDVGANAGYFAVVAADLGAGRSRVVAFEPNPHLADMIAHSITLNPSADIRLERAACGDTTGLMPLYLTPEDRNSGMSTLRRGAFPQAATVQVPVVRLDDYCAQYDYRPNLLKIDVEGFESEVLRGAGWLIDDRVPSWILCEITTGLYDPDALIGRMRQAGYECRRITEDGEFTPVDVIAEPWEDVCFVRI